MYGLSKQIAQFGTECTYKRITQGVYDVETSSVANTEVSKTLMMYPKHIIANQYHFPSLIGKEVITFHVTSTDLGYEPKVNDLISYNSKTYKVNSWQAVNLGSDYKLYKITSSL